LATWGFITIEAILPIGKNCLWSRGSRDRRQHQCFVIVVIYEIGGGVDPLDGLSSPVLVGDWCVWEAQELFCW
jgi:hypothetical protein